MKSDRRKRSGSIPTAARARGVHLALCALAWLSCKETTLRPISPSVETGSGGSGGSGGARNGDSGIGLPGSGDGPGTPVTAPDSGEACIAETHVADRTPVDLLFLVDVSPSMIEPWEGMTLTRGQTAKQAIFDFINDPKSAQLGVALQYFPFGYIDKPCTDFSDCGQDKDLTVDGTQLYSCVRDRYCELDAKAGTFAQCGGADCVCALSPVQCKIVKGSHCAEPGRCALSQKLCVGLGKPCPTAGEGDCQPVLGKCNNLGDSCAPALYERLRVPFTDLPAGAKTFLDASDLTSVSNGPSAPLVAAIKGSMVALKKRGLEKPARPSALVIVTGAQPGEKDHVCQPADPLLAKPDLEAASKATPAVPTYVIGVLKSANSPETAAVNQLAAAGGTGNAFVLDGTMDVPGKLHEALAKIRNATLACDFPLPEPKAGGTLDVHKVNVSVKTGPTRSDLIYVGKADRCGDPAGKGGWHYDVDPNDPKAGGQPARLVLCPSTCAAMRKESDSSVDVAFGCTSRIE